ncbi:DNA-processing protein DprA [Saxibacter everestensis]|uniref:DNA-processing protein DprA n=1 Tax=Saxibacter everestensis TaxID=2909229 RepID=A0ABY8QVN0_9MICO|nr:DNA-processing protein DprA [Brevibacteriaceae bacterium ZFBP1038]
MTASDVERLARAGLSRLAEPGDETAWALVQVLGAVGALELIRSNRPAPRKLSFAVARQLAGLGEGPSSERPGAEGLLSDELAYHPELAGFMPHLGRGLQRWRPRVPDLNPERDLATVARFGGRLVIPGDDEWPERLRDLGPTEPLALWVRGAPSLSDAVRESVALVGSRHASAYGRALAADWAYGLVDRGYCVVSGGAYGIDAQAHVGALNVGESAGVPTVSFLAGGIDRFYPGGNTSLFDQILENGLIVAEAAPGCSPRKFRFLLRNRLIAASSRATVVIEAGWRSGALNTAHQAAELMRPVGAVPGSVFAATSAGCHRLLREACAICVTDISELVELAGPLTVTAPAAPAMLPFEAAAERRASDALLPADARLLDALPVRQYVDVTALQKSAGMSLTEVRSGLSRLELAELAARAGTGWRRTTRR